MDGRISKAIFILAILLLLASGGCENPLLDEVKDKVVKHSQPPAAPVAAFTLTPDPAEGDAPLSVTFQDTSTGEVTSREWDFTYQAGSPVVDSTLANPTHLYNDPGGFSVRLKVIGPGGEDELIVENCVRAYGSIVAGFELHALSEDDGLARNVTFVDLSESLSSDTITGWAWDIDNDGDTDYNKTDNTNVTHYYGSPGTYTVKLTVSGPAGSDSEVKTDYITVGTLPNTPSGLQAVGVGTKTINLSWNDTSSNEDGFKIYRDSGSGYGLIETVEDDVTTYQDTGLTVNKSYSYRVKSYNHYDESPSYTQATGTTLPTWTVVTLPDINCFAMYPFALDSNDRPHILWWNSDSGSPDYRDIVHTWHNGSSWQSETIANSIYGIYSAIAIDAADNIHVSFCYVSGATASLRYRKKTGASWGTTQVVDSVDSQMRGLWNSIAVDGNNDPHISYHDYSNRTMKYAYWAGSAWGVRTIRSPGLTTERNGGSSAIAVRSSSGYILFNYFRDADPDVTDVFMAQGLDNSWSTNTNIESGGTGEPGATTAFLSVAIDGYLKPHGLYYHYDTQSLTYVRKPGSVWEAINVDGSGHDVGIRNSIAVGGDNVPRICYADWTDGSLKYAYYNGSSWVKETMDDPAAGGFIAVDSNNLPHIYYLMDGPVARYAKRNPN